MREFNESEEEQPGLQDAPTPSQPDRALLWRLRLERAFSFRVILASIFLGFLVGYLLSLLSAGLFWFGFWGASVLSYLGVIANDKFVAQCPQCLKRVKLGANRCHHCGWSIA